MPPRLLKILLAVAVIVIAAGGYMYMTRDEAAPPESTPRAEAPAQPAAAWNGRCNQLINATFTFGPTRVLVRQIDYSGLQEGSRFARVKAEVFVFTPNSPAARKSAMRWIPDAFRLTSDRDVQWVGIPYRLKDEGNRIRVRLRFAPSRGKNIGVPAEQLKSKTMISMSISVPRNAPAVSLGLRPPSTEGDPSCDNPAIGTPSGKAPAAPPAADSAPDASGLR